MADDELALKYLAMLSSPAEKQRLVAAMFLGTCGLDPQTAIPALLEAIRHVDGDDPALERLSYSLLGFAALSLAKLYRVSCETEAAESDYAKQAWTALLRLSEAKNEAVAHYAIASLGRLGELAQPALPLLRRLAQTAPDDGVASLRARAYQALVMVAPEEAAGAEYSAARDAFNRQVIRWREAGYGAPQSPLE